MNPFDAVGTARIRSAVYDRMCRLSMTYQSAEDEIAIVRRAVGRRDAEHASWLEKIVELVRLTREHDDLRVGSSVRGAIDTRWSCRPRSPRCAALPVHNPSVGLDAAIVALSGRVRLREGAQRTSEGIITELWQAVFGRVRRGGDGEGKAGAPTGATNSR